MYKYVSQYSTSTSTVYFSYLVQLYSEYYLKGTSKYSWATLLVELVPSTSYELVPYSTAVPVEKYY